TRAARRLFYPRGAGPRPAGPDTADVSSFLPVAHAGAQARNLARPLVAPLPSRRAARCRSRTAGRLIPLFFPGEKQRADRCERRKPWVSGTCLGRCSLFLLAVPGCYFAVLTTTPAEIGKSVSGGVEAQ